MTNTHWVGLCLAYTLQNHHARKRYSTQQLCVSSVQVDTISNFEWQRQLRYYWDLDQDTCLATMALATYVYGYEYLGACPRLVITPLTVS